MGIIHVLDEQLTNMIAAGEVVDRPVNIVKECVENSLDAGASVIDIEVFQGGIEGVIVTDDGCGMSFEDARMAFERHATSKISSEDELFSISTMGFRGEALPSIASVAQVDVRTANDKAGTRIVFEYGELKVHEKADVPKGTRIEVRGLFLRTPARFKYLKKPAYEFSVIADAVNKIALAHPEVRFTLRHDNRLVFQTSGKKDRLEILYQMFGRDAAQNAAKFDARTADFHISGYAMQPSVNRASKSYIYLSLNGRTVRSWPIVNAVVEGYREFMPKERYPICYLNVDTDYQLVDVNVHPNKLEVRISKEEYLAALVTSTLRDLFEEKIVAPQIHDEISRKAEPTPVYTQQTIEGTRPIDDAVPEYGKSKENPAADPMAKAAEKPAYENQKSYDSKIGTPQNRFIYPSSASSANQRKSDPAFLDPKFLARTKAESETYSGVIRQDNLISKPSPAYPGGTRQKDTPTVLHVGEERSVYGTSSSAADDRVQTPAASVSMSESGAASENTSLSSLERSSQKPSERPAVSYPAGISRPETGSSSAGQEYFKTLRLIGQLRDSYILCEDANGLVIIDQHAAQERANFERISKEFEEHKPVMQPLLVPLVRSVPQSVLSGVDALNENVERYGIHFEVLNASLLLREVPTWMIQLDAEKFIDDLIAWFMDHRSVDMNELRRHLIATAACHSSIRFNRRLSAEEMKKVISDLSVCRQPYHCPHGRPTVIRLGFNKLEKEFERA